MSASEAPKDDVVKSAAASLSPELMPDAAPVTIEAFISHAHIPSGAAGTRECTGRGTSR